MAAAHTCVLKVHIVAVESIFQPVRHDLKLHYLLAYRNIGFGDIDFHFGVVDLIGKPVADYLREVPATTSIVSQCTILFHIASK